MTWQDEFEKKIVSPEHAVSFVQSGDVVVIPTGRDPLALGLALAARKEELRGVQVMALAPHRDFGWYDEGWADSFQVSAGFITPVTAEATRARRIDLWVNSLDVTFDSWLHHDKVDVGMFEVSPPDKHGYCSFGSSVWNKRELCQRARLVLAEINPHLIRTCGDNYVHVSEIDFFVEHQRSGREHVSRDLLGRQIGEVTLPEFVTQIAAHVRELIRDGDTVQIGAGTTSEPLVLAGALDGKNDIGWHSEATPRGTIGLVRQGAINGKHKTLNTHKCVATAIGGGTDEDMAFVDGNPMFELRRSSYVTDARVIGAHDNMIAINNALVVDLTGQIGSEQVGTVPYSLAGGQTTFAIGAQFSKGGRSVTVLPSTAKGGSVSRIVTLHEPGTVITVPRNAADYVVTEFGVAHLRGKTRRQRAEALIAIAHPEFRDELTSLARKLYWP